ncbi:MAG: T9SS type A sorting domain-containing protein, partial [candidate division Zixibacteria bacterium]|nr:T9SS type A sorting domain-containing protein [candidate division Zixibacteria bacterium]
MKNYILLLSLIGGLLYSTFVFADSPGEQIGTTWYDYQCNLTMSNRISIDELGGRHFAWTNGIDSPVNRGVYYNFMDENGNLPLPGGILVDGTSLPCLDLLENQRAVIAYYNFERKASFAIDSCRGCGVFHKDSIPFPYPTPHYYMTQNISTDGQNRIHIVGLDYFEGAPIYTCSEDSGETWTEAVNFDTEHTIMSGMPVSSNVNLKTSIVYTRNINDGSEPNSYNNDVIYIDSENGVDWDFDNKINITNYQWEDTIRATGGLDAVYDNYGDLHVIWVVAGYWADEGVITVDRSLLYHWSESSGITRVHRAWHPSFPGAWNRSCSKPSIGVDALNNLYVIWTHFDTLDVSAGGYSNGDIHMSSSTDNGETWSNPYNLTNSSSDGCLAGDCNSDHWSSLAEKVDDYLHIFYVNDKDAGGIPQTEGTATLNPMLYYQYPNPMLAVNEDDSSIPNAFTLYQNYPNPFNSSTSIRYFLPEPGEVKLEIFNILGQKIETLLCSKKPQGEHAFTWNAEGYTSGIYYYKLTYNNSSRVN